MEQTTASASAKDWWNEAAYDPSLTTALWAAGKTAPLVIGRRWDLVRIDFTLATAAITQLKARDRYIGPYLMGGAERAMWWLLPLRTGRHLAGLPGVSVCPTGAELFVPPPGKYLGERVWVMPDQGEDEVPVTLTAADDLREALEGAVRQLGRRTPS